MMSQVVTGRQEMQLENFSKTILCSLCLDIISYTDCKIIEEVKDVLEIVLPNLNLEKGNNHRVCKPCYSKLFAAFNFKAICIDTEDIIFPHVSTDKASVMELKEIYLKVNGNIELTDVWENQRICRLCLQLVSHGSVSLEEVDKDIIDIYIPQININATINPVICLSCFNSLRTHGDFLRNCLKAHDKRKNYDKQLDTKCEIELEDGPDLQMMYKNVNKQFYIKSDEIEIKTDEGDQNNDTSSYKLSKKIIDIEETKDAYVLTSEAKSQINSSEIQMYSCEFCIYKTKHRSGLRIHQLKHKDPSLIQMYRCDMCDFINIHKKRLIRHQLIHKDPSDIQMYKCAACDYESKYKSAVKRHQLVHKDPAEIKMYKCEFCTYEGKRKGNLKNHQRRHKDSS